jgi:hypothetical protein
VVNVRCIAPTTARLHDKHKGAAAMRRCSPRPNAAFAGTGSGGVAQQARRTLNAGLSRSTIRAVCTQRSDREGRAVAHAGRWPMPESTGHHTLLTERLPAYGMWQSRVSPRTFSLPRIEQSSPFAVFRSPPLTVACEPLAVFSSPPRMKRITPSSRGCSALARLRGAEPRDTRWPG